MPAEQFGNALVPHNRRSSLTIVDGSIRLSSGGERSTPAMSGALARDVSNRSGP